MDPFKAVVRWHLRGVAKAQCKMERLRREVDEGAASIGAVVDRSPRDMVMYPRITGDLDDYLRLRLAVIDKDWS